MKYAVETTNLTKDYQKKRVVNEIDLRVPTGSIYALLGPNGAGKTTTMKMLLGLVHPTAGSVTLLGEDMNDKNRLTLLRQTGSLIESPSYYGHLTGRENLQLICMLKGAAESEIDHVLSIVRLEKQQNKKAAHYSLGMKQRLAIAAALLGSPRLLLLDEPTNGLDPAGIQEMRDLICSLPKEYGMTILISSHLLSEVDQMADCAGIIRGGELIFQSSLSALHEHSRKNLLLKTMDNNKACLLLKENKLPCRTEGEYLLLPALSDPETVRMTALLVQNQIGILRLTEKQKSLEDIFLSLTGKKVSL